MKKIFAEIGFGNETFLSTEIEQGNKEYRIAKLVFPKKITNFYLRFWIFKKVLIISTNQIKLYTKQKNNLKIIFDIQGVGLK